MAVLGGKLFRSTVSALSSVVQLGWLYWRCGYRKQRKDGKDTL